MAYQLRVKQGCTIIGPCNEAYPGGSLIPVGVLSGDQIDEKVKNGFGEAVNIGTEPLPNILTADIPGVGKQVPASVDAASIRTSDNRPVELRTTSEDGVSVQITPPVAEPEPVRSNKSLWTLDPAELADKSIDDLNLMVMERDEAIPAFETVEEAIAFLSQDFTPAAE